MADDGILIEAPFAKPLNVVGLVDPDEEGGSFSEGFASAEISGLATGAANPPVVPGAGGSTTFSVISQSIKLTPGGYRVDAVLEIQNPIDGAEYDVRLTVA